MTKRAEVRREADEALKQEIAWHKAHRGIVGLTAEYKRGFLAGLRHARNTVELATKVIRNSK